MTTQTGESTLPGQKTAVPPRPEHYRYDVFIRGEVIDLCVPGDDPWVLDQWYRWFNDSETTRHMLHGIFPNTLAMQKRYLETIQTQRDRLALLIKPKRADYFVGVASLSSINLYNKQCDFALVIGRKDDHPESLFYAMEAKCRMTEHAFEVLGMERIYGEQVYDLAPWQRWQVLFGFQIEGIKKDRFRKGLQRQDGLVAACVLEDYLRIKKIREGAFWPGKEQMFELMKKLPRESSIDRFRRFIDEERKTFWESITFKCG